MKLSTAEQNIIELIHEENQQSFEQGKENMLDQVLGTLENAITGYNNCGDKKGAEAIKTEVLYLKKCFSLAHCTKCGDDIKGSEPSICGYCAS